MIDDEHLSTFSKAGIGYLASDPEELAQFMNHAGYDPGTLRAALGTKALSLAVMDYFAANEPALLAMCANSDFTVGQFMRLWQKLNAHE